MNAESFRPKGEVQQRIEAETGEDLEITLRRLYLEDGLSQDAIAIRFNTHRDTIRRYMRDFGIETRYLGRGIRKAVA